MINGFAGAEPRLLREFRSWYPDATIHTLGENHRCAPSIVRASASVIACNPGRFPKDIRPAIQDGKMRDETSDAFRLVQAATVGEEGREAIEAIRQWRRDGIGYGDMAILVRVKAPAALIQVALKAAGIPFAQLDSAGLFTSAVGSVVGAYLRLCHDPDIASANDIALALSTPPRNLARNLLEGIGGDGWSDLRGHPAIPSHAHQPVRAFCETAEQVCRFQHDSPAPSASAVLWRLLRRFGLEEYFSKEDGNTQAADGQSALDSIAAITQLADEHAGFGSFVDWYTGQQHDERMMQRSVRGSGEAGADRVRVLTIHRCKGDEFKAVVLFHITEGVLPHAQAMKTGDLEEERRVLYVGLTRAIDRLLVTTCKDKPSRFLRELPQPAQTVQPLPQPRQAEPAAQTPAQAPRPLALLAVPPPQASQAPQVPQAVSQEVPAAMEHRSPTPLPPLPPAQPPWQTPPEPHGFLSRLLRRLLSRT